MRRSLAIGIVGGCVWLQLACGRGVLSGGGDAGPRVGTAGAGGRFPILGAGGIGDIGGGGAPSGDAGDPFAACNQPMPVVPVPPTHVILLDSSSAMNGVPCAGCDVTGSRWANAVEAINATVSVTQADVRWGLDLFGDATNACGTSGAFDVNPALGTGSSIEVALGARTDGDGGVTGPGNRPTRSAVLAATRQLMFQTAPERSFIVVLTAGAPNCAPRATDTTIDDRAATVEAIRNAFLAGYGTFIVGLGLFDAATNESLQQMASAGNPNVTGPVPNLYTAFSSADVQSVLRSLVHYTSGCTFEVPPPPNELTTRSSIQVFWGDLQFPRDTTHTNGWDYTDGGLRAFQFYGPACDLLRTDRVQLPVIRFHCPLI